MGCSPFKVSECGCGSCEPDKLDEPVYWETLSDPLSNPDPKNFTIEEYIEISKPKGVYTILIVKYHDCINYEGKKVMVYKGSFNFIDKYFLDPHFCDKGHKSPIARFEPTDRGIENAYRFVNLVLLEDNNHE